MKRVERIAIIRVLFLVTITLVSAMFFSQRVKADENIEINATNFPDENFRSYVSDSF